MARHKYNNGRRYTIAVKQAAIKMRAGGFTHREIAKELGISKSSACLWTLSIQISPQQKVAIEERRKLKVHRMSQSERKAIAIRLRKFYEKRRYSKQSLLNLITEFMDNNGRIPLKCELNKFRIYKKHFGSWNNAIISAGFEPNPVKFARRMKAVDGHMCDSFSEKIVDDWLSAQNILHQRSVAYPDSKMTADFFLSDFGIYVELFGLKGVNMNYDKNVKRKVKIVKQFKLSLLSIYMEDIIKKSFMTKIQTIIGSSINQSVY